MNDLVVHRLNTGWLYSEDNVSLLAGGIHHGIPGGTIRPYGWQSAIRHPDGRETPGTMVPAPAWLILGGEEKILVDTGTGSAEQLQQMQRRNGTNWTVHAPPECHILARLQALGLQARDIDVIVQTHLHFDHIGATELFPRARILVHHAELSWALCPPPFMGGFYAPDYSYHVRDALDRIEAMHHDVVVAPGVEFVHTGGHSPGHGVVFVDTKIGRVVLAGDCVYNYRNLEYGHPQGPFTDLPAVLHGMHVLRSAEVIVLNHDALFDELFRGDVIGAQALAPHTTSYMKLLHMRGIFSPGNYSDMPAWETGLGTSPQPSITR